MTKKTLLLAENDADMMQSTYSELKDNVNMSIIQATDGIQAFQKTRNQTFDVILTNWILPKISGRELIDSIRDTNGNENTPIIIQTEDVDEVKSKCRGLKGILILKKPVDFKVLTKSIIDLSKFDPNKKKFRLDVDFVNPFIDMSVHTLNTLCNVDSIKPLKPYLMNPEEQLEIDISGTIKITSPYFSGVIGVSFSNDIYKKILEQMIEEKIEEINADNQDGAAEIINIIYGNTKALLNNKGFEMKRAIPSVIRGNKHKITPDSKTPILLVPFDSNAGRFFIQICVKAI
jgi:chemotaxis protein CheX